MRLSESFKLIVIAGIMSACGTENPSPEETQKVIEPRVLPSLGEEDPRGGFTIEKDFVALAESFEYLSKRPVSTPIYFAEDLGAQVLGACITWSDGRKNTVKEIKINRAIWQTRDEISREMIIYHELGHCELDRAHITDEARVDQNRLIPFSLMFPSIFATSDYSRFRNHFILELFGLGSILPKISDALSGKEVFQTVQRKKFVGTIYP